MLRVFYVLDMGSRWESAHSFYYTTLYRRPPTEISGSEGYRQFFKIRPTGAKRLGVASTNMQMQPIFHGESHLLLITTLFRGPFLL